MGTPFGSEKVITQHISEAKLKTYFVGFDIDCKGQRYYRLDDLIYFLERAIPEFAFGNTIGPKVPVPELVDILREAARSIYRIKQFQEARKIYENGGCIADDNVVQKKYLERGEFGELILHLLLRDFHATIPLLSKIYFKDAYSVTVHGFDAVHVHPDEKTLWLGEAKLYVDGKKGVHALTKDVKDHFQRDYLNEEFAIISKKLRILDKISEKDHWLEIMDEHTKLSDVLSSVTIPLLCTYSSDNFKKYDDEAKQAFVNDYEKEVRGLQQYFDENCHHPLKTNLNIVLMLFPVRCKNELVRRMHQKLWLMQEI
jgi:hypothetical protein